MTTPEQAPSTHYPHLSSPLTVQGFTLRNRSVMGSMHTGLEEHPLGFERLKAYYRERAIGQAGLIISGGVAPNRAGWAAPFSAAMITQKDADAHKPLTDVVHEHNGLIAMQILHAGRYGYHPFTVAPSRIKSPISPFAPWPLTKRGIKSTIDDFTRCALLAQQAGYDGIEIMGSEGYLLNQFVVTHTNKRDDQWGGSFANRMRFPVTIVKQIREKIPSKFMLIFRLSIIDLIPKGSTFDEVIALAKAIEEAGADLINSGIGWHEARVPTIATMVPRAAFASIAKRLKAELSIPLIATNRINHPQVAEDLLSADVCDLVSLARPWLADPHFMLKAKEGRADEINTCIACNQACLDHTFLGKISSCLVNPQACHETELVFKEAKDKKRIAVIGAGPAGLSFCLYASQRGHLVTLFDTQEQLGGQFLLARNIPGKDEFNETLRYFRVQLAKNQVQLKLGQTITADSLNPEDFDLVIVATGITPRMPSIPGIEHKSVVSYLDVISGKIVPGNDVVIMGAGGIGFDVASFLAHDVAKEDAASFFKHWGIDPTVSHPGGLNPEGPKFPSPKRNITMVQRKGGKLGANLGKTTGWIHRSTLAQFQVRMYSQLSYELIDDQGLHVSHPKKGKFVIPCDHIVICAGQETNDGLVKPLIDKGFTVHVIGGAHVAKELDAKAAINEGARLAAWI